jgi:hypothetical protein
MKRMTMVRLRMVAPMVMKSYADGRLASGLMARKGTSYDAKTRTHNKPAPKTMVAPMATTMTAATKSRAKAAPRMTAATKSRAKAARA